MRTSTKGSVQSQCWCFWVFCIVVQTENRGQRNSMSLWRSNWLIDWSTQTLNSALTSPSSTRFRINWCSDFTSDTMIRHQVKTASLWSSLMCNFKTTCPQVLKRMINSKNALSKSLSTISSSPRPICHANHWKRNWPKKSITWCNPITSEAKPMQTSLRRRATD